MIESPYVVQFGDQLQEPGGTNRPAEDGVVAIPLARSASASAGSQFTPVLSCTYVHRYCTYVDGSSEVDKHAVELMCA